MKQFSTEDYSKINAYLDKEMTAQELTHFEAFLKDNPEWSSKVEEVKEDVHLLKRMFLLDSLEEEFDFEKKQTSNLTEIPIIPLGGQKSGFRWEWAIAACLGAGLIIFGGWQYNEWQKEKDREELARLERLRQEMLAEEKRRQTTPVDFATKIPTLLAEPVELKGISDKMAEKMTALNDALDEVAQQDAIKDLEALGKPVRVPQEKPTGETYGAGEKSGTVPLPTTRPQITASEEQYRRLLLGIGYLRENQLDKALTSLNNVTANQLQADVAWYKSLVFIQQKKYAEAKTELLKIESNTQYGLKAKELLAGIPQ